MAVNVSGTDRVGGLAGANEGRVTRSYSSGWISGGEDVGGLVGYNDGRVTASYSSSAVTGGRDVGGFVGRNYGSILSSYSSGRVSLGDYAGGLTGSNYHGQVLHSVWDKDASGLSGSAGGVGLTTAEMKDPYILGLNGFANDPNWVLDVGGGSLRLAWEGVVGQTIAQPHVDWLEGQGTAEEPYRIDSGDQLILLSKSSILWNKHFVLGADIDLNPTLSGRRIFRQAVIQVFAGVFDGKSHVISNLMIEGTSNLGLFGRLMYEAQVRNVGVVDVNIVGLGHSVGGLVGENETGTVDTSYSTGTVNGKGSVGGLVGGNYGGSILSSHSAASVNGEYSVGGVVGRNYYGKILSSHSSGSVSGEYSVGGLVGVNGTGTIDTSYGTGTVNGKGSVGGLVGSNYYGSILSSHSTGSVSGNADMGLFWSQGCVGGLVGDNAWGHITACYSTSTVTGTGLEGFGGLVGENFQGSIDFSHSTGAVSGDQRVGGLVGYAEGGTIVWSYRTGSVSGTGWEVGGLVGKNYWGLITTSCSTGAVSGTSFVGGLVGNNGGGGRIVASYSTAAVNGSSEVGGLVGRNIAGIDLSYSTGMVSGTSDVGGLVGRQYFADPDHLERINMAFWDSETSGQTTSAVGVPKTTARMKDVQTFVDAGWDFETVWTMTPGEYPRLERRETEAPDSGGWIRLSPMKMARDQFAGASIGDEIFVFGGNAMGGRDLYGGEKYNVVTDTWSDIADNPYYEHQFEEWLGLGVEELSGIGFRGKFYVFGAADGYNYNEMYDPATNTWTTLAEKPTRTVTAIPVVYESKIYLFGGSASKEDSDERIYYDVVEAYDPENNEWESVTQMPVRLTSGKAVAVHDSRAYIIGGYDVDEDKRNDEVFAYDFETGGWIRDYSALPANAAWWYSYATGAPVVNGKVYLIGGAEGGYPEDYWISDKVTIFDIESKNWESGPELPVPRADPLTVVLKNTIYVIGGEDDLENTKDTVFALSLPASP